MRTSTIAFALTAALSVPSTAQVPEWSISQRPALQIGAVDADSVYLFHGVTDVGRLPDGRLAVADRNGLRIYSSAGSFLYTVTRAVRGPGEYATVGQLLLKSDSILLWDPARRNRLFFGPDGRFLRQERVDADFTAADGNARFVSFEFSTLASPRVLLSRVQPPHEHEIGRFERLPQHFLVADMASGRVHELGAYPGQAAIPLAEVNMVDHAWQPYSPDSYSAAGPDRIYIGDSGALQIDVYTHGGARLPAIQLRRQSRPVERHALAAAKSRYIAAVDPALRQVAERAWSRVPMPEVLPHYGDLLVDASGRIWIADYATDPDAPSRWTVISPEGRELGIVRLPANFTIKRAGADYVTGVWRDELDVEYVQVWTLSQDRQTC